MAAGSFRPHLHGRATAICIRAEPPLPGIAGTLVVSTTAAGTGGRKLRLAMGFIIGAAGMPDSGTGRDICGGGARP